MKSAAQFPEISTMNLMYIPTDTFPCTYRPTYTNKTIFKKKKSITRTLKLMCFTQQYIMESFQYIWTNLFLLMASLHFINHNLNPQLIDFR